MVVYLADWMDESQEVKEHGLLENSKEFIYTKVGQTSLEVTSLNLSIERKESHAHCKVQNLRVGSTSEAATSKVMVQGYLGGDKIVLKKSCNKDIASSGSENTNEVVESAVSLSSHSEYVESGIVLGHHSEFSSAAIPKYLNLEPSLAMDWLEIDWDELHIKERVGAGNPLTL